MHFIYNLKTSEKKFGSILNIKMQTRECLCQRKHDVRILSIVFEAIRADYYLYI